MAAYLDTSHLVALFFNEPASTAARERASREKRLWVSTWTLAEYASAVAFKLRSKQTTLRTAGEARLRLNAIVASGGLDVIDVERADIERAGALCAAHASGLRTPDALHAALAARLTLPLLTCDRRQHEGCTFHGIASEWLDASTA